MVAPGAQSVRDYVDHSDFLEATFKKDFDARKTIALNDGVYAFIPNVKPQ